jgi:hypothetical protein
MPTAAVPLALAPPFARLFFPAVRSAAGAVLLRNVKVKAQTEKPLREEIVE